MCAQYASSRTERGGFCLARWETTVFEGCQELLGSTDEGQGALHAIRLVEMVISKKANRRGYRLEPQSSLETLFTLPRVLANGSHRRLAFMRFNAHRPAITHPNSAVSDRGSLWIVRNHQHGLVQFAARLAQHPQHGL